MIAINLLPKNLRKFERRKITLPYKTYLAWVIIVLVFLHLSLFIIAVAKEVQILSLKNTWRNIEAQSKDSSGARREVKELEAKVNTVKEALSRKASLTELLSSLNAAVPKGLWLDRYSFSDDGLLIQGSVVSLNQNEMTNIGKFLQDLKNNKLYSSLFPKIELNSVQRRTIKTYDVVDFVLTGEAKK